MSRTPLTAVLSVCNTIHMTTSKTKATTSTDNLVSIPQAARELGVHHATIYRWIQKNKIHTFRINDQKFLTTEDVEAIKKQREQEGIVYTVHRPIKKRKENG